MARRQESGETPDVDRKARDARLAVVLREVRQERGMSQEAVAHAADLSVPTYIKIENERTSPLWITVRAICDALELSLVELGRRVEGLITADGKAGR
jgi:DNA-binding XRE family transcriptional regulator